jgi:hypothetical protein
MKQIKTIEGKVKLVELLQDFTVNCKGPESNSLKTGTTYFKNLLTRGFTKADVNGLGIQTTLEGRVVGSGRPIPLYALDFDFKQESPTVRVKV